MSTLDVVPTTDDQWSIAIAFLWRAFLFAGIGFGVGIGLADVGLPQAFAKLGPMAGFMFAMKVWFDRQGQPSKKFWVIYAVVMCYLITSAYYFDYLS